TTETIPTNITTSAKPQIDTGVGVVNSVVNPVISESFTPDPSYSANPLQVIVGVASYIWVVGLVLMVIYCAVSYIILKRKVSASVHYNNNIYYCDNIETPFILGVIKPKIYIPSGVNESDLQFILEHEKSHIKRKDYLVKPLSFLLLSVYWFNPAIWLWYILLCRDIESACDEKAIKFYDNEYKKLYSTALLNCSTQKRMIMACPVAFGETGVKQRIKSVLNYKKPAFWVVGFAIILTVWLTIFFVTNPENDKLEKILSEDGYQIINATEKKVSFEFMSSAIRPEMSEDGNYKIKSTPFVVNDSLELQFTELLSRDDRYTLTFKSEYQVIPDEGTIYIVNANQFDGGLELGDKILLSDSLEVPNVDSEYVATCSSQGPGTEFSFSVPKVWFEDRQDNKIVVTLDMLEVGYKKIDSSEEEKTENYVYADENTGTLYRIKDNYYYGVINVNNYQNIGLYLKEVDGDNRFICDLNTHDITQSVVVGDTFYYKCVDYLYKVDLSPNAQPQLWFDALYSREDNYYTIEAIETVSGKYIYCQARHWGVRDEYPEYDIVYLKIDTETETFVETKNLELPKVDIDFLALLPEIENVLNAKTENVFVQKMNFRFESNSRFNSALVSVQFVDKNNSNLTRTGNLLIAEDLSLYFNETTDLANVQILNKGKLTAIDKVLEKVNVIYRTDFCLKNVEKTPDSFQLIYFGKALLENGVEREEPYTLYYDSLSYVFS
ncbi:MAG: M56 family metallopeptidase, partial [Clostridia bacterium]|nr:M56 family metallopeptidase [Clostridia bacterium]